MEIEEFIKKAGESESRPEEPLGGIPKQKLSNWIRIALKSAILPFILLDLSMQKLARLLVPPPYKKIGHCKKRGNCCHYIIIKESKGLLSKVFWFWSTEVNGFFLREKATHEQTDQTFLVMGCRHLDKDGSCKQYRLRPVVCRTWPIIEHFGKPQLIKGCGYKAVLKKKSEKLNMVK